MRTYHGRINETHRGREVPNRPRWKCRRKNQHYLEKRKCKHQEKFIFKLCQLIWHQSLFLRCASLASSLTCCLFLNCSDMTDFVGPLLLCPNLLLGAVCSLASVLLSVIISSTFSVNLWTLFLCLYFFTKNNGDFTGFSSWPDGYLFPALGEFGWCVHGMYTTHHLPF